MLGLSTTSIGQRTFHECLDIYNQLKEPLNLEFLELAVGSTCDLTFVPKDMAVVVHDRSLHSSVRRIPFSINQPETWNEYERLFKDHDVRLLSVHPPLRADITLSDLKSNRDKLETLLGIPVCIEIMPNFNYWLSQEDFVNNSAVSDIPILIDISHVNIWSKGTDAVIGWVSKLLPQAIAIHLSHNNGYKDSHDMIPKDIWFNTHIQEWKEEYVVTYESLPEGYEEFERMDKRANKLRRQIPCDKYLNNRVKS